MFGEKEKVWRNREGFDKKRRNWGIREGLKN